MLDKQLDSHKLHNENVRWARRGVCFSAACFSCMCIALFFMETDKLPTQPGPRINVQMLSAEATDNATFWRCYNKGQWIKNRYIPEDPLQDCGEFVKEFLKDIEPKSWIFLGDSTMQRLFKHFVTNKSLKCRRLKKCQNRCTLNAYMKMSQNVIKGKGCSERTYGCQSELHGCQNRIRYVEYIQNHFSRNSKTTNMTIYSLLASYLHKHPKNVCVINTGLHDQGVKNLTDQEHVNNVKHYLGYLNHYCERMIWISINSVLDIKTYKQTNSRILLWNKLIDEMLLTDYPDAAYIDMYAMSTNKAMHLDNVHMTPGYYKEAANFFL